MTPENKKRISAVVNEVAGLETRLAEILTLKSLFQEATVSYARGDLDLISAASLVTASGADRDAIQSTLRQAVKLARTEALQSLAAIVAEVRASRVAELEEKCKSLEAAERNASAQAGIEADKFTPSQSLNSFRSKYAAARRDLVGPVIPSELAELVTL